MYLDRTAPETLWFRITLYGQPGPEPPLGWTLAPETVDAVVLCQPNGTFVAMRVVP